VFLGPDLVAQHLGEAPPPPSSLRAELPREVDDVLARALAKAPGDRFASAAEMAAAVATWPIDTTAGAAPPEPAPVVPLEETTSADDVRELGATARGRIFLRREPRTARLVLVEQSPEPLDDEALADVRRRAAAGGPDVQRVLRLSDDRREIWYEAIEGEPLPASAATDAERDRLDAARADLPLTHFARTEGGPVWLVAPLPER
jgi:hypothetical protein